MDKRTDLSVINTLPAAIPPTSKLNFLRHWWQRSEKSANIAEARIIKRIYDALPGVVNQIPTVARIGRISIDNEDKKQINTLYITQNQKQDIPYKFEAERTSDLDSIIRQEDDNSNRNLVICHGYGAGLGFFYRNYQQLSQVPDWRLFSIDWLGMGNSSRPKWTISRKSNETWDEIVDTVEDHFVESLESWRNKVGINKMTLSGHSLGGYFATCYALKYPERVEKLILISPGKETLAHNIINLTVFYSWYT